MATFKWLPYFELCHFSFGETLLFVIAARLIYSFDHPLDSHAAIFSVIPPGIVKVLKISQNINKF